MRKALTIGELLVTMAIIGVIATLVLPGFLKDYHKKLYTTHLKKTYEMLENAINQACTDNNVSYFIQTPYVQSGGPAQQAFIDKYFKRTGDVDTNPFAGTYKVLGTDKVFGLDLDDTYGWGKLAGGEAIALTCLPVEPFCVFFVDINSIDGPNIGGRDLFPMFIDKKTNKIYDPQPVTNCGGPSKKEGETDAEYEARLADGKYQHGYGCFARILEDNWQMKY